MCFGSPNNAANEAQQAEQARLAAITATQQAVNNVFDSSGRTADIADYVNATRDYYTQDLNQQKDQNDRQLRFALARGGQLGGSLQLDKQTDFAKDYAKALLSVDKKARGAGADLETQDQDARARLITLATTGLDATTGAQQAAAAMKSSLEGARANSQVQGLGDMFKNFTDFYQSTRDAAERRRGWDATGLSLYQPNTNFASGH